jgi:glucose 1-dehydrogenase
MPAPLSEQKGSKELASTVAPRHIRVNGIAPGAIRTQINAAAWSTPAAYQSLMDLDPYCRISSVEAHSIS